LIFNEMEALMNFTGTGHKSLLILREEANVAAPKK